MIKQVTVSPLWKRLDALLEKIRESGIETYDDERKEDWYVKFRGHHNRDGETVWQAMVMVNLGYGEQHLLQLTADWADYDDLWVQGGDAESAVSLLEQAWEDAVEKSRSEGMKSFAWAI